MSLGVEGPGEPTGVRGEGLSKVPTGIQGFDEISGGGLPRGRATLVCGGPGSGKTLFGMEFLVRGATEFDEPGVFVSFEETSEELAQNVASLGFDVPALVAAGKLAMDHVRVERSEIEETGEYNLDGLFIRLGCAIDAIGARRIVLDTIELLFGALSNEGIVRAELHRLLRWLKDRGLTVVLTGERGAGTLTRHGLEEYVSDCVISLEQRVHDRIATRYLRIIKYRGSLHGTNEYPFLLHERGISVLPITSVRLEHRTSTERISLGIPRLDAMLGGKGVFRGTSVLVSGTAGSGKTSIAVHAADAACRRGERCLYFAFEESRPQIERNARSIGIDLAVHVRAGLLRVSASRPTMFGLEMHLTSMHRQIEDFAPDLVVIDPISNLVQIGSVTEVRAMLTRLVDFMKSRLVTAIFISLSPGEGPREYTEVGVSSLMDAWILVSFVELNGERNRTLYVLKSRGMAHSNQLRELVITDRGLDLADVYVGRAGGLLLGTGRHAQEIRDQEEAAGSVGRIERMQRELARRRQKLDAQITALQADFEADEERIAHAIEDERGARERWARDRRDVARIRQADPGGGGDSEEASREHE